MKSSEKSISKLLMAMGLATLATFSLAPANAVEVYKSIGPNGEPRYTQEKPRNVAEFDTISLRNDGRREQQGEMAGKTNTPQVAKLTQAEQQALMLQERMRKEEEQGLVRKCQALRNNLTNLNIGGKIYETDEQGNKKYLSDSEINDKKAKIRQAIAQFCANKTA